MTLHIDVGFQTVNHRIYCRKFLTLSNQKSHYIRKCIRIVFNLVMPTILAKRMSQFLTKPTKWHVRLAKTQISLDICPVYQSLLCAQWVAKAQAFFIRTAKTLIRLGGCPGWSESSLGAHAILLVLLCGESMGCLVNFIYSFLVFT